MKIGFNPESIVDLSGKPLAGRVTMYLHDSDVKLDVFTMEGEAFVQAQNPQLLNNSGRLDATLFFDAAIVDVKVERYIGPDGQMSVGSPDTDFEQFDYFEVGFDPQILSVRSSVDTIAELMDADPSSVCVDVIGYYAVGDCVPRTYYWDADSQNDVDGGYVIGSNVSDSGRWILLWGDEMMPSSVYGIVPGTNEANISALLDYPLVVGSFLQKTAPIVRFISGSYSSNVSFSTQKSLFFDTGAKFTDASFTCNSVENSSGTGDYIADLTISNHSSFAHSSWFRTVDAFWHCGASTLIVDETNDFADTKLRSTVDLQGKTVHGYNSLVTEYVNGAYFKVGLTSHVPDKFFSTSDIVQVLSAGMGDEIFKDAGTWDPGSISQGHHVLYSQVPELELFRNADRWLATMIERRARLTPQVWSLDTIDLQGRTVSTFELASDSFGNVKNCIINGYVVKHGGSLGLTNVNGGVTLDGASLSVSSSTVHVTADSNNVPSISAVDTLLTLDGANGIDPADTRIAVYGGHFNGKIALSDAHAQSFVQSKAVDFRNVSFETAFTWKVNLISMTMCSGPVSIDLYPVNVEGDYLYRVSLDKNVFTGSSRVWFTVPRGLASYSGLDGKVAFGSVRIVDNSFETSDQLGIKMLRWNPGTLNRLVADNPGPWEYHGNSGNCPRLSPGAVYNGDGNWDTQVSQTGYMWCKYASVMNIFAPYVYYSDGSINYARDNTGLSPDNSSGQMCMCCPTVNASPVVLICGYCAGQSVPQDGWDENLNDLFVLRPAITSALSTMTAPTTGFTYWYQQGLT